MTSFPLQVNLSELSEMTEQNFIDMGIFKLNELDKLKRICNLLNDSQNTSYWLFWCILFYALAAFYLLQFLIK